MSHELLAPRSRRD